jgi:beta-galactosidase
LTVAEPNPSQVLDYYRFSSDAILAFQQLQIEALRAHIAPNQLITTNCKGNYSDLDYAALARRLDFVSWDSYPTGFKEREAKSLYWPGEVRGRFAYDVGDPFVTGFCHGLSRGLKRRAFWVMEQQAGHINWGQENSGVRPGTVRLWTWHAAGAGAEAVLYFRWRAGRVGQEQFHSGLLRHDGEPDGGYAEAQGLQAEAGALARLAQAPVEAPAALLLDYDDLWALQLQPHRKDFGYFRHLFLFYRALQRWGIGVDIVPAAADLSPYRLVIAPTAFVGRPALAQALTAHAARGAIVLLGVRSGFKDEANRVVEGPLPGVFRPLAGITVAGWQALPPDAGWTVASDLPGLAGPISVWAEALRLVEGHPDGGEAQRVLARYEAGPWRGQPALTERALGAGRALYLGFYPSLEQAEALAAALLARAGLAPLADLPRGVLALRRGATILLLNFTDVPQTCTLQGKGLVVEPRDLRLIEDPAG